MDRWTDMTKLTVAFHDFANAPKKKGQQAAVACKYCATTPNIPATLMNIKASEVLKINNKASEPCLTFWRQNYFFF